MAAIMTGIVASAFSNQMSRKKASYEAQLREVLADGIVSGAEQETLQRLQRQYRLTDDAVTAMMEQMRQEKEEKDGK
jgi:voltage-gated potassium channel